MDEERIELVELETTESEEPQEEAEPTSVDEASLQPEDVARRLFASYLEPPE